MVLLCSDVLCFFFFSFFPSSFLEKYKKMNTTMVLIVKARDINNTCSIGVWWQREFSHSESQGDHVKMLANHHATFWDSIQSEKSVVYLWSITHVLCCSLFGKTQILPFSLRTTSPLCEETAFWNASSLSSVSTVSCYITSTCSSQLASTANRQKYE